jgi:hypothetical protein
VKQRTEAGRSVREGFAQSLPGGLAQEGRRLTSLVREFHWHRRLAIVCCQNKLQQHLLLYFLGGEMCLVTGLKNPPVGGDAALEIPLGKIDILVQMAQVGVALLIQF